MKVKQTFMIGLFVTSFLTSCDQHPSFSNSTEAVNGCHEVLAELREKKEVDNEELTKLTAKWLETQDSAYSVFGKDSTITLRSPVALAYFMVSDSIRRDYKIGFFQASFVEGCYVSKVEHCYGT